jgi:cyclic 2,3-diphosphoglycerate synthetase
MKPLAVALIDGEHYPPVVVDALSQAGERYEFVAALFLGGTEKVEGGDLGGTARAVYGLPVLFDAEPERGLERALAEYGPEVVVDLSDEPVLGYEQRFSLISHSLARGVGYVGSDFHFSPPSCIRLRSTPSLSIIGTAKRIGKTAVSGFMARTLQQQFPSREGSPGVVVVAMGRGGPQQPEVVDGRGLGLSVEELLRWSRSGRHAASDHFEDAALSRVVTVGCRRCGGGLAGEPFVSNVAEGARVAEGLRPDLVVFEGSGATAPPVAADARVLVAGAQQPVEHIAGYLGTYRVLTSDALILTMAEEPLATRGKVHEITRAVDSIKRGMPVVPVVFRPQPMTSVKGRRVAFFTTAPVSQQKMLRRYLEERHECRVEMVSSSLSDRKALRCDLAKPEMQRVDTVLTEIKAAAVDVVAETAVGRGLAVVFVDNIPHEVAPAEGGALAELARVLAQTARERFHGRG